MIIRYLILLVLSGVSSKSNLSSWEEMIRHRRQSGAGTCILPPYPRSGSYAVGGKPDAKPGDQLEATQVHISCHPGYQPDGNTILYCVSGAWSSDMPKCVRFCKLDPHPSVKYRCQVTNENTDESYYRDCEEQEPTGTIVRPQCNEPNYYFTGLLSHMRCINGRWNYIAICQPQCGTITPNGKILIIGGREVKWGEFPWHAGIYRKDYSPYKLICGGSVVSSTVIISAAHCFWNRKEKKLRPATSFAVALGKYYREWNNPLDDEVQKFDVVNIKVPARYQDAHTNYQDDIAILWLSAPAVFRPHVRPVCLDFDPDFNAYQLREGNIGKVAGWGIENLEGTLSPALKVLELPYVRIERCIEEAPSTFRPYITSDKICAGYTNGSAVCQGDSGGGLVFMARIQVTNRFYLRGIVSTAPESDYACNAFDRTTFTQILKHKEFIENNIIPVSETQVIQQEPENPCILPPYPEHGSYSMLGSPGARPGQGFLSAQLTVNCNEGYVLEKNTTASCSYGRWSEEISKCIRKKLDCGREDVDHTRLKRAIGGHAAQPGEMPWNVGVYTNAKALGPFMQICGGSIIKEATVVAAAHCFWQNEKVNEPSEYAVAAGKLYNKWDDPRDAATAQKSEIKEIKVPKRFRGHNTNYQDDIAILKLAEPFKFNRLVRPVCVDFDLRFHDEQLQNGNLGKVAGWGYTSEEGAKTDIMNVVELPYIDTYDCFNNTPRGSQNLLTSDKICAGYLDGTAAICAGDSGNGLVFPSQEDGGVRYFLRGVSSVALRNDKRCNSKTFAFFTDISRQKDFILK